MSDWRETALAAYQRHDVRHTTRVARLFGRLSERPVGSLPTACQGWAETGATSRFLPHPAIGVQEMWSGHTHATRERSRPQEVVWLVQAPPFLHDGTIQPQAGMGTVKSQTREAYRLHLTGAFTPARVKVGGLGMQVWQRPEEPGGRQHQSPPGQSRRATAGGQGRKALARSNRPVRPRWWCTWPSAQAIARRGGWPRGAARQADGPRCSSVPRSIGVLRRAPRRGMCGP
jgi:hypothetical protein